MSNYDDEAQQLFEDEMRAEAELELSEQQYEAAEILRDSLREDGEVV